VQSIAKPLLKWFDQHGRHTLPWQSDPANVYHVWLSEIMLQQTQVSTVIDYFNNFIQQFPTLSALANASEDEVLAQWAGLGYYARARNLHACAKIIINTYRGDFPTDFEQVVGFMVRITPYSMVMLSAYYLDTIRLRDITGKVKH